MAKDNAPSVKIVVTGPESSGKTTLARALARHYNIGFVPEYSRQYLPKTGGVYNQNDLLAIAKGQISLEDELARTTKLLLCDTSLEVIRVWSEWKYNQCDPYILRQARQRAPDLFLLLQPDIPWEPDPLRENPTDRQALFAYFQKTLAEYPSQLVTIGGSMASRLAAAIRAIDKIIKG